MQWELPRIKINVNKNISFIYKSIQQFIQFIPTIHTIHPMRLHPLPISSSNSNSNYILQPNLASGANPSGAHFVNPGPQFASTVGGVTGCGGAGGSAAALAGNPGYNITAMKGGTTRRGGSRRNRCKCRSKRCHCRQGKRRSSRGSSRRSSRGSKRRMMRGGGGGAALSAAPFNGGANLPYQQYMGGQPNSPNFSVGSEAPLINSGMANPPPISPHNYCSGQ